MNVAEFAAVAVVGCVGSLAAPVAGRFVAQARLARLCARRRAIVLTYDDGPGEQSTPRMLDLLAEHGVRATFFALGEKADRLPSILDRMVREGHEVGCHSYAHVHAWRATPWRSSRDVRSGLRALAPWLPCDGMFRPPHGKLTPWTWFAARSAGARFGWWTIDSGDTWAPLPPPAHAIDAARRGGGVVLMHDFDRQAPRSRYVHDVTVGLIRAAQEDGLRIVPLGELLAEAARDDSVRDAAARKEVSSC